LKRNSQSAAFQQRQAAFLQSAATVNKEHESAPYVSHSQGARPISRNASLNKESRPTPTTHRDTQSSSPEHKAQTAVKPAPSHSEPAETFSASFNHVPKVTSDGFGIVPQPPAPVPAPAPEPEHVATPAFKLKKVEKVLPADGTPVAKAPTEHHYEEDAVALDHVPVAALSEHFHRTEESAPVAHAPVAKRPSRLLHLGEVHAAPDHSASDHTSTDHAEASRTSDNEESEVVAPLRNMHLASKTGSVVSARSSQDEDVRTSEEGEAFPVHEVLMRYRKQHEDEQVLTSRRGTIVGTAGAVQARRKAFANKAEKMMTPKSLGEQLEEVCAHAYHHSIHVPLGPIFILPNARSSCLSSSLSPVAGRGAGWRGPWRQDRHLHDVDEHDQGDILGVPGDAQDLPAGPCAI
jgi:hypothetical protein